MKVIYSKHWKRKQEKKRKDIMKDMIEFVLLNSSEMRDKHWANLFNKIARVPPSGRTLKVVYKKQEGKIFIVTSFWLD